MKFEIFENRIVGNKRNQCSILFTGLCFLIFFNQKTSFKLRRFFLAFTYGRYLKIMTKGIYSLGTHTIQSHTFLKYFAIEFGARVYLTDHVYDFAQGNATTIVTNSNLFT